MLPRENKCDLFIFFFQVSHSPFFHLLDFVAVLFVGTFEFIYHFFATLRKNFFVIDKLVNERQVSLNCGFVFLSLNSKSLFRIFLHLLCLPKREFTLLVLYRRKNRIWWERCFFQLEEKITVLPTGVESMTFWLPCQMLYHWATGDSGVGIKATKLARLMWQIFRILLGRWTVDMRLYAMIEMWWCIVSLASVVQTLDSPIHWINHYPADKYLGKQLHYPLDRDLPIG